MKFTVEVEEFWLDEEEDLTEALQGHVKREVVRKISESVKDKVEKQIVKKLDEVIEQKLALVIDSSLADLVATGMITYNRSEVSIVDHIKHRFQSNSGWGDPSSHIDDIAKKFGAELKAQYNNVFANKIVQNMKEQGLLKDEVVQILLGDK